MTSRVEAVAEILWHRYSPDHEDSWPSPNADEYRRVASDILSALATEPAAPEGRQEAVAWQHIPGCGTDRESKMVSVSEGVFCDPCIAPLVAALNAAGFATVASCCGHGHRPSVIALRDGRELFIAKDFNEARQIDAIFPIDINGNTRPAEQAVTEAKPFAFCVHDFHVARMPVKARGKFEEPTEYYYPASRENDARETARLMGATCTPLYAGKESA